jgi:transposase
MAGKRLNTMDLRTLLRYIRADKSNRSVAHDTGVDRRTVARYRKWAEQHNLLDQTVSLPPLEEFAALVNTTLAPAPPPQNISKVEPFRELVLELHQKGVEGQTIYQRIKERGFTGSRSSVYRFLHTLTPLDKKLLSEVTVRVEHPPGDEAQVDFGYVGRLKDETTGQLRKVYAFVMTLAYSRHMYLEFVFEQDAVNWAQLHRHAFEFFGGVPKAVRLDNLKAGIIKNSHDGTDPLPNWIYQECAEHYGFLIRPCRPRTPQHKGSVESNIHFVQRRFWAGRELSSLAQANREGREWCLGEAGQRKHGTTHKKPLEEFERVELAQLRPLPPTPYDLAQWKQVKVQPDCYVVFDNAFYSVPFRLITQTVRVRGGATTVKIYNAKFELMATHSRSRRAGERITNPDHLPPTHLPALLQSRESVELEAAAVGPATLGLVKQLLADAVIDRLDSAGRVVRLGQRSEIGVVRLEAACRRCLAFDEISYKAVKSVLKQGLENEGLPVSSASATVVQAGENGSNSAHSTTTTVLPAPGPPAPAELAPLPKVTGSGAVPPASAVVSRAGSGRPRFERGAEELLGHLFKGALAVAALGEVGQLVGHVAHEVGVRLWN